MDETPLDRAHAGMEAAPENTTARLRFYDRLADAELFLLLDPDSPDDGVLSPRIFPVEGDRFVLVFDREERLAEFAGPANYATISGRRIALLLSSENLGLGLNLSVAPSSILIPPDAVAWLAETLDNAPDEIDAQPETLSPPTGLPESLLTSLDAKLAGATDLAHAAYLVGVAYKSGVTGHMLAFIDPRPGTESALANAVAEALTFSGIEAGCIDVAFFDSSDPISARLSRVGLRFDLPATPEPPAPISPGMNPDIPPRLK